MSLNASLFREQLEQALAVGGNALTLDDVDAAIDEGRAQLWESDRAVLVTEVNDTPRLRELHFFLAAGDLETALAMSEEIIAWGRSIGCRVATLTGRRGWERVLSNHGWTSRLVMMGREI